MTSNLEKTLHLVACYSKFQLNWVWIFISVVGVQAQQDLLVVATNERDIRFSSGDLIVSFNDQIDSVSELKEIAFDIHLQNEDNSKKVLDPGGLMWTIDLIVIALFSECILFIRMYCF